MVPDDFGEGCVSAVPDDFWGGCISMAAPVIAIVEASAPLALLALPDLPFEPKLAPLVPAGHHWDCVWVLGEMMERNLWLQH